MPTETYWLPYPALLTKLGFTETAKNGFWRQRSRGLQIHTWHPATNGRCVELSIDGRAYFLGELQSEAEFYTVLRQIGWGDLLPASPSTVLIPAQ